MDSAGRAGVSTPAVLAGRSVALVHEWFSATGGSEAVFLALADLVPHARRFVLWADTDAPDLRQSWLARTPLRRSKALALPVMPLVWRTLSREPFDVVISSSHAFAHTVRLGRPGQTRHLSYVHSPARYLWSPDHDARGGSRLLDPARRVLRRADQRLSRHVDAYAANSREVRDRIRRFWGRDAEVIHPPVDVDFFTPSGAARGGYLLAAGRWVPYKRFDLAIEAAALAGLPLVVAGSGPQEGRLRRLAARVRVPVTFEVRPDRERLRELYRGAAALLFPGHEDFGIVPVEAQACGTPVIGLRRGGATETVVDGETGVLVDGPDPAGFAAAVARCADLDSGAIRRHATGFSADRFAVRMARWITDAAG